jgi:hypothetical protein
MESRAEQQVLYQRVFCSSSNFFHRDNITFDRSLLQHG